MRLSSVVRARGRALCGGRTRRGASYVEILVIVAIVLVFGLVALRLIGLAWGDKSDKQASCLQSFSCADGATSGAGDLSQIPRGPGGQGGDDGSGQPGGAGQGPGGGTGPGAAQEPQSQGFGAWLASVASRAFVGVEVDLGKVRLAGSASPSGLGGRVQSVPFELIGANALGGRVAVTADISTTTAGAIRGTAGVGAAWGPASVDYIARYDSQNGGSHGLTGQIARQAPVVGFKLFGIGGRIVVGVAPPSPAPSTPPANP